MVAFVVAILVIYVVAAVALAALYEAIIRWRIVSRVQAAGWELLQVKRLRARVKARQAGSAESQAGAAKSYYVVRYRNERGHELTRLCTLSTFGGVIWYDEE
jgi:uncharacterized protein YpmB